MIHALHLSLAQLADRRFLSVLGRSLLLTLLLFALAGAGLWWGLRAAAAHAPDGLGGGNPGWLAGIAAALILVLAWWLLFRTIVIAVTGLFADEIVAAVEARHYPAALATARAVPLGRAIAMGLGSAGRTVAVNLVLLPLYLVLLATGIGGAALFFLANAWLLGRDLGDMVAARHLPREALAGWRRATRVSQLAVGAMATALLLVPVLNLVAPLLGAAIATHSFHRRRT